jgi:hypothetical protein
MVMLYEGGLKKLTATRYPVYSVMSYSVSRTGYVVGYVVQSHWVDCDKLNRLMSLNSNKSKRCSSRSSHSHLPVGQLLSLQENLLQLPPVDMQANPILLPLLLPSQARKNLLAQSLCTMHSDCALKLF